MRSLLISVFSAMLGLGIVSPLMPLYARDLGATGIWLGMIFSGFSFSRAVFMPIIGRLSDRFGKKIFITIGLALYSVISVIYIIAENVYELVAIRIFHGFSSAMVIPCAMAYISEIAPEGSEGKYMSSFNISMLLGIGFGPIIGGIIKDVLGLKFAFLSMSILTVLAFLLVMLFVPNVKVKRKSSGGFKILLNKLLNALIIFRLSQAFRLALVMSFLPILISHLRGYQIGIVISAIVLTNAVFQKPFGVLADRYDRRNLILLGSLTSITSLVLLPFYDKFANVLMLGVAMGIGNAMATSSASAIAVNLGRELGHGTVMGFFNMALSIAMTISPLLAGFIMDVYGLDSVFFIIAIISAVGVFIFYALSKV